MKQISNDLKFMVESNTFGVCERLGEKLQMPAKDIRMFFENDVRLLSQFNSELN